MHPHEHRDSSQVLSICRIQTAELVQEPACHKLKLSDDQAALPYARLAIAKRFSAIYVSRQKGAVSSIGGLRTPAPECAAPPSWGPASENLHKGGSDAKAVLNRSRTVTTIKIAAVDVSRGLRRTASGSHPDPERGILALRAHTPRPDTKLRLVAHREAIQHRLVHSEWARCGRRSSEG